MIREAIQMCAQLRMTTTFRPVMNSASQYTDSLGNCYKDVAGVIKSDVVLFYQSNSSLPVEGSILTKILEEILYSFLTSF